MSDEVLTAGLSGAELAKIVAPRSGASWLWRRASSGGPARTGGTRWTGERANSAAAQ